MRTSAIAALTAAALFMPLPLVATEATAQVAVAQEPAAQVPAASIADPTGAQDSTGVTADNAASLEDVINQDATPTSREQAPNTDTCPNQISPTPARTTSEALAPGTTTPTPLPVAAVPAGGAALASCGVVAPAEFQLPENLTASAWMVFDIDSGEILSTKDPHGRYRPASIIKALLGLVAIEELDPTKIVTGTYEAANIEGSRVGVGEGGQYTVDQLLHGLLLASGNDAAYLLAQDLGGDEITLQKVNALAQELGTQDTYAATYSGLDAAGMSTSAYDMSLIYQHAWQNSKFAEIIGTEYIDFPGWGENEGFQVWNDNSLFMNDPDGIGGKTGYTDDANHTFVGGLDRNGRRLAAVILDTTIDKGRAWEQARTLIDASLIIPQGGGVGQLGTQQQEQATTLPAPTTTATAAAETPDSQSSTSINIAKVAIPLAAIALLVIAAVLWTFRKRR
ncbi:D-alanyl-D-alanine carboxypeptidase family protein [Corynebacterium callunae]|uniref:D-alanyl-D-alanine carboxypeptidase family protein n=1 Tax=Corynebacterium callunae TaxID=1721 RepID=UPI003982AEB1